jgi:hypothetical protein
MSVASGLSLAFVLIELRRQGAGGVRRRGRSRRLDEGGKEQNLPGVYAREPYIWTGIKGRSSGRGTTLISEPRKHQPLAGEIFVLTT